tara:strand:- start:363 stop:587 length:225 start_codon:yes stop_codon:yes gene_type:complete
MSKLKSDSVSKNKLFDEFMDEFNPCWEKLKSLLDKQPKETVKFFNSDEHGWSTEINLDLLGLPKETTKSSLYKE